MPPQFFFQLLQLIFILDGAGWTQLTDPVVDLGQFLGQAEKRAVSFHLPFRLFQFRPYRQIARLRLAADADVPQVLRSMPGMILTRTSAVALAALAKVHRNGATAEIPQILHLAEQVLPAQLQILQRLIHSASCLNDVTHSDYQSKKRGTQLRPTNLAHTHRRLRPCAQTRQCASATVNTTPDARLANYLRNRRPP